MDSNKAFVNLILHYIHKSVVFLSLEINFVELEEHDFERLENNKK